ncbi:MAG: DNA internalization-related competence protein ComEC/Rec2 [Methylococcaceae bacterium]|jgi:competence protein ComEC
MVLSGLFFLAGISLVQQLAVLPGLSCLVWALPVLWLLIWRRHWPLMWLLIGVIEAVSVGHYRLSDRLASELEGLELPVTGYIADLPKQDERRTSFNIIVTSSVPRLPHKLHLTWYYPEQPVKAGQLWQFTVKLKRPHGSLNPGGFDYERYLFSLGIGATGYVRNAPAPGLLAEASWYSIAAWRQNIADKLAARWPNSSAIALIKALSIGDGNDIKPAQWQIFRDTGTLHLIVISGSHIGLIAGIIYLLVLKFWARTGLLSYSPYRIAALSALVFAVIYALLAGFSIPVIRALLMLSAAMLSIVCLRHSLAIKVLALALIIVLAFDPLSVLSPGFWLSFLAVFIIIYVANGRLSSPANWRIAMQLNWATALALAPVLAFAFQQVSLIAPLANIIAVPVVSFLAVPLSLLIVVLVYVCPALADWLLIINSAVLNGLVYFLSKCASLPLASLTPPEPPLWALGFAWLGCLLLLAPAAVPGRWLGVIFLLPTFGLNQGKPQAGAISFTLLDVGQGLSAVIQTANHVLVYDTGAKFSEENDSGQSTVLPFLHAKAIDRIDSLVISHGDNDHIGGAESVLRQMAVEQVLSSVPEQIRGFTSPSNCLAGQTWQWDEVTFSMLSPDVVGFESDNNNSCVLKIQAGQTALLLTGDIEAQAESQLVKNYADQLQADVLIAPHHGSKTSSSRAFLQAVKPKLVLIPSGYRNPFRHPHPSVLRRYQQMQAHWLSSANSGAIQVDVVKDQLSVAAYRETNRKYWHSKD